MVQVELATGSNLPKGYLYTKSDVEEMCKVIHTSGQLSLNGWMFFSYNNMDEIRWVKSAILDALNHPELFNAHDSYGALCNLKEKIKRKNAIVLKEKYDLPPKYEYRSTSGINAIVDANNDDKIIMPTTSAETLDLVMEFNKNRDVDYISQSYVFHHKIMNLNKEYLLKFKKLYLEGEFDNLIKFICNKSNERGGFQDHGVGVVRNRVLSNYLKEEWKDE